jgi:hypothetical protein
MFPPVPRRDSDRLPPMLRALLEAELAAGNSVAEVDRVFPAPTAGADYSPKRSVMKGDVPRMRDCLAWVG